MEFWNYGIMEFWNYGITEIRNYGNTELWNFGILELRNYGIMEGDNEKWVLLFYSKIVVYITAYLFSEGFDGFKHWIGV